MNIPIVNLSERTLWIVRQAFLGKSGRTLHDQRIGVQFFSPPWPELLAWRGHQGPRRHQAERRRFGRRPSAAGQKIHFKAAKTVIRPREPLRISLTERSDLPILPLRCGKQIPAENKRGNRCFHKRKRNYVTPPCGGCSPQGTSRRWSLRATRPEVPTVAEAALPGFQTGACKQQHRHWCVQ